MTTFFLSVLCALCGGYSGPHWGGTTSALSGTWVASGGVLSETSANTGRILRPLPEGTTSFAFTYRSPHDAENTTDYDPERYGLAVVRLFVSGWKYAALVLEPTGLYLREWNNDVLVGELASAPIAAKANKWYDVKVAYSGTGNRTLTVSWAERGAPLEELLTATLSADLAEASGQQLGFGVGQLGDYEFRNAQFRDASSTEDAVAVTYQYDALGRRIAKTVDPGGTPQTTLYYYDGDQVIEERNGSGAVTATYVYGVYVDEPLQMTRGSEAYYYYTQDDQYNVVALTDSTGAVVERYAYDPFGAPATTSSVGNPFLFTGREWDSELNAYWYRSRYYDPQAGRFTSRDALGLWGDPMNLGNPYAYVGNNPWSCGDPFGLASVKEWMGFQVDWARGGACNSTKAIGKAFGYSVWNVMSAGVLSQQDELVSAYETGRISGSGYGKGTLVNAAGSAITAAAVYGSFGLGAGGGILASGGLGATMGVEAVTGGMATQDLSRWASGQPVTTTTADYLTNQAFGAGAGFVLGAGARYAADALGATTTARTGTTHETAPVQVYEVGTADALKARSVAGDGLDIHHAGQARLLERSVPGYNRATAPAIALPRAEHRLIPTVRGPATMTPRDLLANDIRNLRSLTEAPNRSLLDLIQLNKQMYPEAFKK